MRVIETAAEMRAWSIKQRCADRSIGCVPTMGALHEGHLSLMRAAAADNDVSILTIFVNPAQFAPNEDYDRYPRTFDADQRLAENAGMDVIYAPDARAMYPERYATFVEVERLSEGLCSKTRPHFFRGVATVVVKLFNATLPDRAYFGQKDGQQAAIIRRLTRDLDFGIEIVVLPTCRESDGLAVSSRNAYLSAADRQRGLCLSRSLFKAERMMQDGERDARVILDAVCEGMRDVDIDYAELVDAEEIAPVERVAGKVMLAVAARVGDTRLIDNITFDAGDGE